MKKKIFKIENNTSIQPQYDQSEELKQEICKLCEKFNVKGIFVGSFEPVEVNIDDEPLVIANSITGFFGEPNIQQVEGIFDGLVDVTMEMEKRLNI